MQTDRRDYYAQDDTARKHAVKPFSKEKRFFRYMIYALIFVLICIQLYFSHGTNFEKLQNSVLEINQYSDEEILSFKNHPKVYDNFDSAVQFYDKVDRTKVKVSDNFDKVENYHDARSYLLYMDNDVNSGDTINQITINLGAMENSEDLTLDDAVKIAVSYLPMDKIDEFYDFKRAYIHEFKPDNAIRYHYSYILKDDADQAKIDEFGLNKFFGFVVNYHKDTKEYLIVINEYAHEVNMITDHPEHWFDDFTVPWEIDLNEYL